MKLPQNITNTARDGKEAKPNELISGGVLIVILNVIIGLFVGMLPDLGMIYYMTMASQTFSLYDKSQSLIYYHQVPSGFIMGLVMSIVIAIVCAYSKKTRLITFCIAGTLSFALVLAFFIFLGWLFGSDTYGYTTLLVG
jgi:hypothetical protein